MNTNYKSSVDSTPSYPDEIYDQITEALDLPQGSQRVHWVIEDHVENTGIYLIHYVKDKINEIINTSEYKSPYTNQESQAILSLRGLILDIEDPENPWICCRSNGYTAQSHVSQIFPEVYNGVDNHGFPIVFKAETAIFQPFYSGPIMRVWKYKGKTYCSSHHKIDTAKSRWGSKRKFQELFIEKFGNNCKTLDDVGSIMFNPDKPTSNTTYVFVLSVPKISLGSRYPVGDGFLVFIKYFVSNIFYSYDAFQRYKHAKDVDIEYYWLNKDPFYKIKPSGVNQVPKPPVTENENFIIEVPNFGHDVANKILLSGYSDLSEEEISTIDERLRPGESIIMITADGRIVKLMATCVYWRHAVLNNNPNIYNQFFHLLEYTKNLKNEKKSEFIPSYTGRDYSYHELFPDFGSPSTAEIQDTANKMYFNGFLSQVEFGEGSSKHKAMRNINLALLYAVPHHALQSVGGYYVSYLDDLKKTQKFFIENLKYLGMLVENDQITTDPRFSLHGKIKAAGKALKFVFENALSYINVRKEQRNDRKYDKKTNKEIKLSDKELLKENIENFIVGLKGSTLYSLVVASNANFEKEE